MKVYYNSDMLVLAVHSDEQNVEPLLYGENTAVVSVSNYVSIKDVLGRTIVFDEVGSPTFVDNEQSLLMKKLPETNKSKATFSRMLGMQGF